jgi:hypothetical protein
VNWVVEGGNYGFPKCEGNPDPANPDCQGVRQPLIQFLPHLTPTAVTFYTGPQAGEFRNQMLVTLFVRLYGQGGDLRRYTITGDTTSGFTATEWSQVVDFGVWEEDDGPVDIAIDPFSGDIYVARVDVTPTHGSLERSNLIYRIHRTGSDSVPIIGSVSPLSIEAGPGTRTIRVLGRHFRPGAVVLADGAPVLTRRGASVFELLAEVPANAQQAEGPGPSRVSRHIRIEVQNPDGSRSEAQMIAVVVPDVDDSPQLTSLVVIKTSGKPVAQITTRSKAKKFRLVAKGSNFDESAQLLVNGSPVILDVSSATELVGRFTKAMLAVPGELSVQVRNGSGKLSNVLVLAVAAGQ